MLIAILLIFTFVTFSSVLGSQLQLDSSLKSANFIKKYLKETFHLEIIHQTQQHENILPLVNIVEDIDFHCLKDKIIDYDIYLVIQNYFHERVLELNLNVENLKIAAHLIKYLKIICANCNYLAENKKKLETMADICHLLKIPVQRLILSSELMNIGELFKDTPVLLEKIRNIFQEKIDLRSPFDFISHLNFIRDSFDIYMTNKCDPNDINQVNLYNDLKMKFMIQIKKIFSKLMESEDPLTEFKNGLGELKIKIISFASEPKFFNLIMPSNEELWAFITHKIERLREEISERCPDIIEFTDLSVIDIILDDIIIETQSGNEQFSLKKACKIIKLSFDKYVSILGSSHGFQTVETVIFQLKNILDDSLNKFNYDLEEKINEIQIRLDYFELDSKSMFINVALMELVSDFYSS